MILNSLTNSSLDVLVNITLNIINPYILSISKINWSEFTEVGDQSAYVSDLAIHLQEIVINIKQYMFMSQHFNNFFLIFIQYIFV